tara:strand:- start:1569 stop:1760 length:192 start_codon:yes stop_codon:yes gene_type:complete
MNKLNFEKKKENTRTVSFKIDPNTSKNLTYLREFYSNSAGRRVTTGEIVKQLINIHTKEIKDT